MPLVPQPTAELASRAFVQLWFRLLSEGRWAEAVSLIDEPNSYGVSWHEATLRETLAEYTNGKPCAVTNPEALGALPRINLGEFKDGSGFWLDCPVPLHGEWSDLTAQFEFKRRGAYYAIVLHDLHVL